MKIFINSCHAALEYDQAKMLTEMGHEVSGLFDVGSLQRPKIPGITDVDLPGAIHDANKTHAIRLEDVGAPDVVIVHQNAEFPERVKAWAKQGVPVISVIFGQGSLDQHQKLALVARAYRNVWIVPYAIKEFRVYHSFHVSPDRLRMIRFGKPLSDFDPGKWEGTEPHILVPCNSIHKRGGGCNWDKIHMLLGAGFPLRISGKDTEEIGGLGELTFDGYREELRKAYAYLHVGTIPAPYTLTLVEAACTGTPVLCFDNGHGLAGEEFGFQMSKHAEDMAGMIRRVLTDDDVRQGMHSHSHTLAMSTFSGEAMTAEWSSLLADIAEFKVRVAS